MVVCPICTGDHTSKDRSLYDDRFGHPETFTLLACASCGHRWLDFQPDAATIEALYATYYPVRAAMAGPLTAARSSAAARVPRDVAVLDIGCGAGDMLAYHRERGCSVRGVEADVHAVAVARGRGLDVDHGVFDAAHYAPASFDVVTLDQVLEHVVDPISTLRGISSVLRPGGTVVLSTPNAASLVARLAGDRWIHWHTPYHLQFFTRNSLTRAAARTGFAVAWARTITSPEWLSYQWIHAFTRPRRGERSRFWSAGGRALDVRAMRALRLLGTEAIATRLCDVLGVGDNLVVELRRT